MQSLIGQNIERYHILEQIGEGGMAVVYKALDSRLECNVAIKIIRIDNLDQEIAQRALTRFKNEAKILARLTHPNIVKVTDYGVYNGNPYLVMEYIPGGTLKEKMVIKPFLPAEAAKILIPIVQALSYAHEQGVIHRDIKPSNILITESGEPMITDFGVAKVFDNELTQDVTAVGIGIGTPAYMSPEQGLGQKIDKRSDIYSLGVVFYELISGKQPFQADTPLAVVLKKINDPLPNIKSNVPDVSDAVEAVIIKALSKDPDSRYANCKELVSALERIEAEPIGYKKDKASWILYPAIIVGILILLFIYIRMAKLANTSTPNTNQPVSTTTKQSLGVSSTIFTPTANTGISTNTTSEVALVIEDFNDSKIDMIGFSQDNNKWGIVSDETGNKVFQVDNRNSENYAGFAFGEDSWRNYSIEYKLKLLDSTGGSGIQIRSDGIKADIFDVSPNEVYLAYPSASEWKRVVTKFPSLSPNIWHTLKITVFENSIKLLIDDILWVDEKSSSDNGWIMFFADPGLFAQIDDIKVMELKSDQNDVLPTTQILIDQSHQSFTADPDKAAQEQKTNPDAINIVPMYQGLSDNYSVGLFNDPTYTKDNISNSQILLFPNTNGLFLTSEINTLVNYLNEGNGILITGYSSSMLALIRELGIQVEYIGKPIGEFTHLGWGPWGFITPVESSDQLLNGIDRVTINAASALSVPNSQMVVLYSSDNSWVDENENQIKDTSETTGSFPLIIKAEIGEGRIIIMPAENVWGGFYIDNMKLIDNMIQWLLQ